MSKGPGVLQIKVMQTLKMYHDLGEGLQWTWNPGKNWMTKYVEQCEIESYEEGGRVPVWILIRDLKVCRPALSRAVHGLYKMGYVFLYGGDLNLIRTHLSLGRSTKYIRLTNEGEHRLSVNNVKVRS